MTSNPLRMLRSNAGFVLALFARQLGASFALRGAFFTSALVMLINDVMFFSTWWIIMQRFGSVNGWRLADVMGLFGVAASGFGLCVIVFGGVLDLSRRVQDGDLDTYLTQPKSVLLQALACRTQPSGWVICSSAWGCSRCRAWCRRAACRWSCCRCCARRWPSRRRAW